MNIVTRTAFFNCLCLCFWWAGSGWADTPVVDHHLQVRLDPSTQQIQVTDRIRAAHEGSIDFTLHADLYPVSDTPGVTLRRTGRFDGEVPLENWRATLPLDQAELKLSYGGSITHDFHSRTEAPGKQQQLLAGTISEQGVFLDGRTAWYPRVMETLQTFNLDISLPPGWHAVSQGAGPTSLTGDAVNWREQQPQPDIYLVAAPYRVYRRVHDDIEAQVYLRQTDAQLAGRYLDVTRHYLQLYQALLGDYPYAKFALVENFWETGYGMPSFTLLGPTVIRLPFILHSSYPHEILHNWWGNGVYVDYASGNWSEGLTTYLADHLIKEQSGQGTDYRRNTLQRYASFVDEQNDFPLADFRARHNEGSQAVGYGKGMMLFHMLRRRLGDEVFFDGLRRFYRDNLFATASFDQLRVAFEQTSGQNLGDFFSQWLNRTGAPMLRVDQLRLEPGGERFRLHGRVVQAQDSAPFTLDLPVRVYPEGGDAPEPYTLRMTSRELNFSLDLDARPVRVEFDPNFDLFRGLDTAEIPSSLSELLGSESVLFVLPSGAPEAMRNAYRQLADSWSEGYAHASISFDNELKSIENEPAVWLLGRENLFADSLVQKLNSEQLERIPGGWSLAGETVSAQEQSLVFTHRNPAGKLAALVTAAAVDAVPGLARKLPHYGKYSYLVFEGSAPDNRRKGQWKITDSPMVYDLSRTQVDVR